MPSSNLKDLYQQKIVPELKKEWGVKNELAIPRVEKVVVNLGIGEAGNDKKALERPALDLAKITGQKPKIARARLSIAGFRLREGAPIGLKVTLRGQKMYHFLEKLFKIVLPRMRDFQGVSPKSFDGQGNFSLGIPEYTIFPEVDATDLEKVRGLEITMVTSTKDSQKAKRLLELMGMPFTKVQGEPFEKPKIKNQKSKK